MKQKRMHKTSRRTKKPKRKSSITKRRRRGGTRFGRSLHSLKKGFYKHIGNLHPGSKKKYENNHRRKTLRKKLGDYYHQWSDPIGFPTDLRPWNTVTMPTHTSQSLTEHISNEPPTVTSGSSAPVARSIPKYHVNIPSSLSTGMRPTMVSPKVKLKPAWRP